MLGASGYGLRHIFENCSEMQAKIRDCAGIIYFQLCLYGSFYIYIYIYIYIYLMSKPVILMNCILWIQVGENEPFVSELLSALATTVTDLEPHQIHTFYESVCLFSMHVLLRSLHVLLLVEFIFFLILNFRLVIWFKRNLILIRGMNTCRDWWNSPIRFVIDKGTVLFLSYVCLCLCHWCKSGEVVLVACFLWCCLLCRNGVKL